MKIRCRHCNAPNEVPGTAIEVADTALCCEACGAPLRSPGTAALARDRLLRDSPLSRLPLRKAAPVWPSGACPFPTTPAGELPRGDVPGQASGPLELPVEMADLGALAPERSDRPRGRAEGTTANRLGEAPMGAGDGVDDLPDLMSALAARVDRPPRPRPPAVTPPQRILPVPRSKPRRPVRAFFGALFWGAATLALLGAALAQMAWLRPDILLVDPRVRHWAEVACREIGCEVPPPSDLSAIRVVSHALEPVEDAGGISRLEVRFNNGAVYAQPYPVLQLSLLDTEEHVVARRRLQPAEYLRPGAHGPMLAAGAQVDVRLWLDVPDRRVAGYRLDFVRR